MVKSILVIFAYHFINVAFNLVVLSPIISNASNRDERVGVSCKNRLASPLFIGIHAIRVSAFLYAVNMFYGGQTPITVFFIIVALELFWGVKVALYNFDRGIMDKKNYFCGKTIGAVIGSLIMGVKFYFM